ncbi:autotransporter-associated beta strand repeat-containing protein [Achromobacter ruhlandii]|uniref:autotransporter-associated beta strand repeat-containing protein n=1 Tax=Achromobacter ruhlandii TaxID=72557 RepID=UPI0009F3CEAC|nr:autotransporter-associated beta strand repeat-containing protein [Achromobacter ruhlandii]
MTLFRKGPSSRRILNKNKRGTQKSAAGATETGADSAALTGMPGHAACTPFRLHATTAALCAVLAFAGAVPDVLAAGPEEEGAPADVPMAEDSTDGVAIRLTGGARQVKLEPGGGIEGDIVLSHDDKTLTPPKLSILNSGDQSVRVTGGLDVGTGAEVGFAGNPLGLDGNVTLHDGSALVLRGALQRETPAASFSAGKVFLGQDVTLSLSGIAHRIVRDAPLFSAAGGIEGDFARLMSDGYERRVDYLTLTTRKSEDQTRYLADYDLTWLDTGGRSHGTFTIGADLSDTIGADLHDMAANGASGWDGRSLTKRGTGALTLTGDSTYTGGTTVADGTLRIGDGGLTGSVTGNIRNNAALVFDRGNELLHAGVISGVGTVTKQGAGTLTLTGNNTYTGLTSVDAGTLRIGGGGTTGVVAGDIANQATLVFDRGDTATYAGVISGEGAMIKKGTNTLILTGDNTYTGPTTIEGGALRIGNGGATGSLAGDIANAGTLVFDRGNALTYTGVISGPGAVSKIGADAVNLAGANTYDGDTTVGAGTLEFGGALGAANTLGGGITVAGGATLAIHTPATVDMAGAAVLNDGASLSITTARAAEGEPPESWRVKAVTIGNGVTFNLSGVAAASATDTALFSATDGVIEGDFARIFIGGKADDGDAAAPGVRITDFLTLRTRKSDDGRSYLASYQLSWFDTPARAHGTFLLGADEEFDVGATLRRMRANGDWDGNSLTKRGAGTLILSGDNSYFGLTTVEAGTLRVGYGGGTGSVNGDIVNRGEVVFDRGNGLTYPGVISGDGVVTQAGSGTLTLTGANTYSGGTRILGSTLRIGDGGATGSVAGDIFNDGGQLFFARGDDVTYDGVISGTGSVFKGYTFDDGVQYGAGTLTLTGDHTYTGRTTIIAGTLRIGDGGATGSLAGNILNSAALVFDRADAASYAGIISGVGTVTKRGTNTLTLTGENTHSGQTLVEGGVLRLGDGGLTGSVAGPVLLSGDAALHFDHGRTWRDTYDNVISGSGSVTLTNGMLILTGDNTYTGGTRISNPDSTLFVGYNGTSGSVAGNIVNDGGKLFFVRSDDATYEGVISGTGEVYKGYTVNASPRGDGTLTLTGDHTYTGRTALVAGTLRLGDGGVTGSIAGNILNNAALAFDRSDPVTYAGVISGGGRVAKDGDNVLTLTGGNTYTGVTTINAGTLRIGDGGATGAVRGDIVNHAELVYDRSGAVTYAGAISGEGTVTKKGTNTLTLTGNNTYTGLTTLEGGTLRIGNGGTTGFVTGDIASAATVIFDRSDAVTYSSAMSGTGALVKNGAEVLTLTGANTYGGDTRVTAGTLKFGDGASAAANTLGGGMTVASGATLDIHTPVAVNLAGTASLRDGSALMLRDALRNPASAVSLTAGKVTLGADVTLLVSGIADQIRRSVSLFETDGGIEGDFARVIFDGYERKVDYLTLAASKSEDLMRYLATYDLSWLDESGQAHGTFTLDPGVADTVGADLHDMAANGATGWDGRSLTKQGSGTLTLTGAGTYTGGTTIAAGTLRIGDGGVSGSVTGDILNHATLVFDRGDAAAHAGVIAGEGSVTKRGAGTLTLTGNNVYTGRTFIEAGTLRVGDGGTTGAVAGDIANDAALVFERGDAVSYAGVISGSGAVTNKGTGTLTLTGNSSYTGLTTVEAGTLRIGDGGNTGSLAGDIVNHGILAFERGDDVTYGRLVSGTGALVKNGTNTLTLGGANTYSGATRIEAGTLKTGVVNAFARTAGVMIARDASLNLGGYSQIISQLDNSGVILFNDLGAPVSMAGLTVAGNMKHSGMLVLNTCADCAGQVYTQAGDWVGDGGTVSFGAVLGGDDSVTDKLIIGGAASGTTYVTVANEGGAGAQTVEGIELIRTAGSTEDAFVQRGRIAAGAYDYFLRKGSASGNSPNSWYLTSLDMTPEPPTENPEPPTENPEVPPADDGAQIPEVPPSEDDAQVPELPPADDGAQVPEEPPSDDGAQNPELPPVDDGAQDPEVPQVDGGAQDPEVPPVDDGADPADPPPGADTAEPADPPVDDKADLPDGPADTPPGGNSEGNANAVRVFRPEIGSYASNLAAASVLFNTSLSDRESGEAVDPVTGARRHAWARTAAGRSHGNMSDGQNQFSADRSVLQMGSAIAGGTFTGKDGWRLGVMAGYGNQHSKTRSRLSGYQSRGAVEGYSAGLYGTWYQDALTHRGLYVDGWALYNRFDNTVKGDGLAKETYQSQGVTASLESGLLLEAGSFTTDGGMENRFRFQPQVQVLWSGVKAADHTERTGTRVQGMGANNVQTRLGARLSISSGHRSRGPGKAGTFETFLEANWLHASKQYGVMLDGVGATILGNRNVAELKAGVEGQLTERLGVSASLTRRQGGQGLRATQGALTLTLRF